MIRHVVKWIVILVFGYFSIVLFFLWMEFPARTAHTIGVFFVICVLGVVIVEFFSDLYDFFLKRLD